VWMCSLCWLTVAKNHNFWQILTWRAAVLPVFPPFTDEGQTWCAIADHGIRLRAKFRLCQFILSPSVSEKARFLPFFGLRHLVLSPIGNSLTKLNTGAQLQTFSYPMASKSFLYANAFMAKSGAQSPTFKIVTNKQTNKKTQRFWPPRRWVKSDLYQTWHGDRGP